MAAAESPCSEGLDAVVINASGCGTTVKDYGHMFREAEPALRDVSLALEPGEVVALEIDDHHSVEDIAITLGQALVQALGDKMGINRYGEAVVPMDEALCRSVIDLSGRFYLVYEVPTRRQKIGNFSVELAEHRRSGRSTPARDRHRLHVRDATDRATQSTRRAVQADEPALVHLPDLAVEARQPGR